MTDDIIEIEVDSEFLEGHDLPDGIELVNTDTGESQVYSREVLEVVADD